MPAGRQGFFGNGGDVLEEVKRDGVDGDIFDRVCGGIVAKRGVVEMKGETRSFQGVRDRGDDGLGQGSAG